MVASCLSFLEQVKINHNLFTNYYTLTRALQRIYEIPCTDKTPFDIQGSLIYNVDVQFRPNLR